MIVLTATLTVLTFTAVNAQGSLFQCDRPADNNQGNLIETVIGLDWCLDSDPLPAVIFEPSPLNIFMLGQAAGGSPVIVDLGYGSYIYGDGTYMTNLFVYEKECPPMKKGGRKGMSMGKKGMKMGKVASKEKKGGAYGGLDRRGLRKHADGEEMTCDPDRLGAVLVDAPPNLGPGFGEFIKTFLDSVNADLEAMIVTHEHLDHMGNGISVMEANPTLTRFIAGARVAETIHTFQTMQYDNPRIQEVMAPSPNYPPYEFNHIFEVEEEMHFGNQTLLLKELDGHTPGNLLIWHAASQTLTNVDAPIFPKWSPFFELAIALNVPLAFKLFDEYRKFDYKYFIAGHTTHIGTPEDVADGEAYMIDIADASYRAFTVVSQDPNSTANFGQILGAINPGAPPNVGNTWLVSAEYLRQIAMVCVDIVLDSTQNYSGRNWIEELAAVRVTIFSHCETLADSLRVELPGF